MTGTRIGLIGAANNLRRAASAEASRPGGAAAASSPTNGRASASPPDSPYSYDRAALIKMLDEALATPPAELVA